MGVVTSLIKQALLPWPFIFLASFWPRNIVNAYWLCQSLLSAGSGKVFLPQVLLWEAFSTEVHWILWFCDCALTPPRYSVCLRGCVRGGTASELAPGKPVLILGLSLSSYVPLGKSLNLTGPQVPHMSSEGLEVVGLAKVLKCWTPTVMSPISFISLRTTMDSDLDHLKSQLVSCPGYSMPSK